MKTLKTAVVCAFLFLFAFSSGACSSSQKEEVSSKFDDLKNLEEYEVSLRLIDQSKKDTQNNMASAFDFVDNIHLSVQGKMDKKQIDLKFDLENVIASLQSSFKIDEQAYDFLGNRYSNEEISAKNSISVEDRVVYLHDFKTIFSEFVKKMISMVEKDDFEVAQTTIEVPDQKQLQGKSYVCHFDEEGLKAFAVSFFKDLKKEEKLNASVRNFLKSFFVAKEYEDNVDFLMDEIETKTQEELAKSVTDFFERYKEYYHVDTVEAELCLKVDKDGKTKQMILKIIEEKKDVKSEHFLLDIMIMKP